MPVQELSFIMKQLLSGRFLDVIDRDIAFLAAVWLKTSSFLSQLGGDRPLERLATSFSNAAITFQKMTVHYYRF